MAPYLSISSNMSNLTDGLCVSSLVSVTWSASLSLSRRTSFTNCWKWPHVACRNDVMFVSRGNDSSQMLLMAASTSWHFIRKPF